MCPAPYAPLHPIWFGCYFFYLGNLTYFEEAYNICRQHSGGKSVSFETKDEFKGVEKAILDNPGNDHTSVAVTV